MNVISCYMKLYTSDIINLQCVASVHLPYSPPSSVSKQKNWSVDYKKIFCHKVLELFLPQPLHVAFRCKMLIPPMNDWISRTQGWPNCLYNAVIKWFWTWSWIISLCSCWYLFVSQISWRVKIGTSISNKDLHWKNLLIMFDQLNDRKGNLRTVCVTFRRICEDYPETPHGYTISEYSLQNTCSLIFPFWLQC